MADKRTIQVPVTLPAKDECKACVVRLKETMEQTKGVLEVEIPEHSATMTVHFDPDLLTLRRLEEQSQDACSHLASTYCHRSLVLGGLDCADCARSIERAVGRRPEVLYASVNFATSRLFLESNCGDDILDDVRKDVRDLGYQVWTDEEYKEYRRQANPRPFYLRSRRALLTLVSFFFLLAGSVFWVASDPHSVLSIALLAIATVVGGYSVARDGYYAVLRTRNVDMNVLMTVAVVGAAAIGNWVEAALVVVLFGLGQTLESWAVERTRGSIQALMDLSPDETLVRDGDREHVAKVDDVRVGDVVVVKPGGRVPLDGEIVKGTSAIDESPITGESLPRAKAVGDLVYAGTINQRGALEVRVTAGASDSTLARLIKMVEEAQGQKAPSQRWVDSFAKYYTPVVMGVALVTAVGPPLLGGSWGEWIYRALALLILACPCALVISTPVSIVSAIGAASRQGVLIKGGAHLEAAGGLRAVAFDKTGTLTEGFPRVTEVLTFDGGAAGAERPDDDLVLTLAASVERDSEHPLADAILHAAKARGLDLASVSDFEALPGRGAQARLGEQLYLVGNPQLFADLGVPVGPDEAAAIEARQRRGETVILLGTHDGALGGISIADEVRAQSRDVVRQLHEIGIEQVLMLTGDNRRTAEAVASDLGLDGYRAELMPDQKVGAVRELLAEYGGVAMVGDGINDAPALATATVGIAMGAAGTDTAIETADIALMADDLSKVPFTISLSRATRRTVWQNIVFALALKLVASLLVFPGWLALWMAVLTDTGGSLVVIANGLRLLRHGRIEDSAAGAAASIGLPPRRRLTPVAAGSACSVSGCSCSVADHDTGHPEHHDDHDHEGHDHTGDGHDHSDDGHEGHEHGHEVVEPAPAVG